MKTPEEMADEYCDSKNLSYVERLVITKGFIDGYQAAKPQWISVKERLPKDGEDVLVFDEGVFSVNSLSSYTHKWHPYENGFDCEPSYWMPLPEAPKEEK